MNNNYALCLTALTEVIETIHLKSGHSCYNCQIMYNVGNLESVMA